MITMQEIIELRNENQIASECALMEAQNAAKDQEDTMAEEVKNRNNIKELKL